MFLPTDTSHFFSGTKFDDGPFFPIDMETRKFAKGEAVTPCSFYKIPSLVVSIDLVQEGVAWLLYTPLPPLLANQAACLQNGLVLISWGTLHIA